MRRERGDGGNDGLCDIFEGTAEQVSFDRSKEEDLYLEVIVPVASKRRLDCPRGFGGVSIKPFVYWFSPWDPFCSLRVDHQIMGKIEV